MPSTMLSQHGPSTPRRESEADGLDSQINETHLEGLCQDPPAPWSPGEPKAKNICTIPGRGVAGRGVQLWNLPDLL